MDDVAAEFTAMRHAETMARQWGERYADLRAVITDRMGDAETATIAGRPVVRYTHTVRRRISADKVRGLLPAELVELVSVETTSRRFTLTDGAHT